MSDVHVDVPTAEDRETVLYCLRMCEDRAVSAELVPALFGHFDTVNLWVTACDGTMFSDPAAHYRRKLAVVAAMAEDAGCFLSRAVPNTVCETDLEAQTVGRIATASRWLLRFAQNLTLVATLNDNASRSAANTPPSAPRSPVPGHQHDVTLRYHEFSAMSGYYLASPDRYTYNPGESRNCLNPEHLDGLHAAVEKVEGEVSRLEGIEAVVGSSSAPSTPAAPGQSQGGGSSTPPPPMSLDGGDGRSRRQPPTPEPRVARRPLFYNPPLAHFVMLRDVGHWAYSLACRDFHARLLHNQKVVFGGLKQRLAQVKRALPSMRSVFSEEQRREVFDAVDQLHYDATQFLRHLESEASKSESRAMAKLRPASAASQAASPGRPTDPGASESTASRGLFSVLCCRPEVPTATDGVVGPAAGDGAGHRAKTSQLLTMTRHVVADTTDLRKHFDRAFSEEYSSGIAARAQRAASRMLQWAQSATVVFGPPASKVRANPGNAA